MLRIVPHTVPRVGRSHEHFPDGFELHLLQAAEFYQKAGQHQRALKLYLKVPEREFFIGNLMVRIHLIIVMILEDRPCPVGV